MKENYTFARMSRDLSKRTMIEIVYIQKEANMRVIPISCYN